MLRRKLTLLVLIAGTVFSFFPAAGVEKTYESEIVSVKLYQNQAKITRKTRVVLKKGSNSVVITGLPKLLYDWSVKGSLPKKYPGKILSMEVEKKALVKKRQKKILAIEKKLEALRENDQELLDELKNIRSQQKFLDSILTFTNQTVARELATRIPQVKVWDNTLSYVANKKKFLLARKRTIEKKRENIGKKIQKWEFELSQVAGYSYFHTYQSLNRAVLTNRSNMAVQQFEDLTSKYARRRKLLTTATGKIDIEKRFIISIFSQEAQKVPLSISYVIPNTYWKMLYDVRASREKQSIDLVVYSSIYQNTGEDWANISLSLSTGSPINSISPPRLYPRYLDISGRRGYRKYSYKMKKEARRIEGAAGMADFSKSGKKRPPVPQTRIEKKGAYIDIAMPLRQNILSSNKYQKKFLRDFTIRGAEKAHFYYEVIPARVRNAFLRVRTRNATKLPWLSGEGQIFLENEFMGKVAIPFTPMGQERDLVLGMEQRITAKKELMKKFEDTAGVFGGDKRMLYRYRLVIENQMPEKHEIMIRDRIPVSRNKKIRVEVKKLSVPFTLDEEFKKSTDYQRGMRHWKIIIPPHGKKEITYDIVIFFDKDLSVRGLP